MTFRLPMAFVLGALLATGCTAKTVDPTDTDVASDTDVVVEDTDVADTDLVVCDNATDTDATVTCTQCLGCAAPTGCPTEYTACQADVDCKGLFDCLVGCSPADTSCPDACASAHTGAVALFQPIADCVIPLCPNSCSN